MWKGLLISALVPFRVSAQGNLCCQALEGAASVLHAGSTEYSDRIKTYWSLSAQLTPYCIVQPASTSQVAEVVKILVNDASCAETLFAVRSGGHTFWARSNNIDNGVTVDVGLMNTVTLNKESGVASIGSGARWYNVYGALDPQGYTVPGGRVGSVGVAGLLTGGGISFYTARKGFACDNVKNFEMVTASGEVVHANAEENPDLWQALKGGSGANFGIVTRFDMFAFQAGNLWGGTALYNRSAIAQMIAAYVKWTDNVVNYPDGSLILFWNYSPNFGDIVIQAAYEDTQGIEAPSGFDDFMVIPRISDTLRFGSHGTLADEMGKGDNDHREIWFTLTFANDAKIFTKIIELNDAFVQEWKAYTNDADFVTQCVFQAIPTIFSKYSQQRGGNVMGLDAVNQNAIMFLLTIAVKTAEEEARARPMLRYYGEQIKRFAIAENGLIDWEYLNYADSYQDPLGSYGAQNVAKIRAASRKVDPSGIFQDRVPGGFKISRAMSDGSVMGS